MAQKITTSFGGFAERNCTAAICLDIRSNRKDVTKYPLCIRFIIDRKSYYHRLGGNYTKNDFSEIANTQKSRSGKYEEKKNWRETIDFYADMLKELGKGRELTLDMIRAAITGKSEDNTVSFLGIWQGYLTLGGSPFKHMVSPFLCQQPKGCRCRTRIHLREHGTLSWQERYGIIS